MKKITFLLLVMISLLVLPVCVFADEEDNTEAVEETTNEAIVYFFRGEGCSHCAEAEAWFNSIEETMGDKFKIIDYETWYSEDNAKLMTKVAKVRGEEERATGVPYIIIGDKSWIGFDQADTQDMTDQINAVYDQNPSERYDVMSFLSALGDDEVEEESSVVGDIIAVIAIIAICGGIGYGIYSLRKANL